MQRIVIEYDDFCHLDPENCLSTIQRLVARYPQIKVNMFTVPYMRGNPIHMDTRWVESVNKLIESNNLFLGLHGLTHETEEFKSISYSHALEKLDAAFNIFQYCDFPKPRVFRSPFWQLSEEAVKALEVLGFTHIYNHKDYEHLELISNKIKFTYWNWNLKDEYAPTKDIVIAHGHSHDVCENGIYQTTYKIEDIIEKYNPEFLSLGDV